MFWFSVLNFVLVKNPYSSFRLLEAKLYDHLSVVLKRREDLGNSTLHALPNKLVHSSTCSPFIFIYLFIYKNIYTHTFKNIYLFIFFKKVLAASGLSCGTWDLFFFSTLTYFIYLFIYLFIFIFRSEIAYIIYKATAEHLA